MSDGACRVAMTGVNTLLGKELLSVLKDRAFPLTHVTALDEDFQQEDPPILDLSAEPLLVIPRSETDASRYDFLFRAVPHRELGETPKKTAAPSRTVVDPFDGTSRFVIHVAGAQRAHAGAVWCAPWLGKTAALGRAEVGDGTQIFVSPHAATLALNALLLPLAPEPGIRYATAVIFTPASELGSGAIEELQKQTLSLLNFGEMPAEFFGGQAAFNLLPRLTGKAARRARLTASQVRCEFERLAAGRAPAPALRLVYAPVFYSTSVLAYVQPATPAHATRIEQSLAQDRVQWIKSSDAAASPVDVQGGSSLFLDPVAVDEDGGFWVWARFDDLRITAENAVTIAEQLVPFLDRG
jgi:aspartate-semialdehyde dehydrogenase